MCNLRDRAAISTPPPHSAKLHPKVLNRIFKFLVANFLPGLDPQLLTQPFPEANPNKMAKFKVFLNQIPAGSRFANFCRVAEAEAVVEAAVEVAVVAAASGILVKTVTAPTSPKNTRRWSTTTMSSSI